MRVLIYNSSKVQNALWREIKVEVCPPLGEGVLKISIIVILEHVVYSGIIAVVARINEFVHKSTTILCPCV